MSEPYLPPAIAQALSKLETACPPAAVNAFRAVLLGEFVNFAGPFSPEDFEHLVIHCDCDSEEHHLRFSYAPSYIARTSKGDEPQPPGFYLSVHLATWFGFWRRLWAGLRYAFGHRAKYGDFDSIQVRIADAKRLRDLIDRFLEATAPFEVRE